MESRHKEHWAEDPEKVETYIFEKFRDDEKAVMIAHLQSCTHCTALMEKELMLAAGIRRFGRAELKKRLQDRICLNMRDQFEWKYIISIAAALVVIFGAALLIKWMWPWDTDAARSREVILSANAQSQMWMVGTVIPKPEAFRGRLSKSSWKFMLTHNEKKEPFIIRTMPTASLAPERRRAQSSFVVQTSLEQTVDGWQMTLYTDRTDGSHLAGVQPTGETSFIIYVEGTQIAYQLPQGWVERNF